MEKPEKVMAPLIGEKRAIVLLVDFSDNPHTYNPQDFQRLLFSKGEMSLRDYYEEVSYGRFTIDGDVEGWFRLPYPYSYYVGDTFGIGSYPRNAQGMVVDAIKAADLLIDFSLYDEDKDGYVDNIFIVHSGRGAEETGSNRDIWSHKWQLSTPDGPGAYNTQDGVKIDVYTTEPERFKDGLVTVGVFCHEFGHILGLPDLYNTENQDYVGPGRFSLMSAGSWNGSPEGSSPSHLCSWSKYTLGWIEPLALENPGDIMNRASLPCVEYNPVVYRLLPNPNGADWSFDNPGQGEYFLIENRYRTGFDKGLPGSGLLILHIDESQYDNNSITHPLVGIMQADGDQSYVLTQSDPGNADDLWKDDTLGFGMLSVPSSVLYNGTPSGVWVKNISESDSVMEADLKIEVVLLGEVYAFPNPFAPHKNHRKVTIRYVPTDTLKAEGKYPEFKVSIYNLAGELIRVLDKVGDEVYPLARSAFWDLKNERGEDVVSGLYFYMIETETGEKNKGRLTVIR